MSITSTLRSLVGVAFFLMVAAFPLNSFAQYAGWTVGDAKDNYGTILRSIDSGSTWARQGTGQIADVNMSGVVAVDPFTAWVVGGPDDNYATIYHTTDGGSTWERKGSAADVPDVKLTKVTAYGDNKVWAVGTNNAGTSAILHTSDGGATWTNQLPAEYNGLTLQGVYTPDGTTVWVGGDSTPDTNGDSYALLLKSTDGGQSWTRQSGGDLVGVAEAHILGISAVDANTAWAVGGVVSEGDHLVLHTINGGETWTQQSVPIGSGDVNEVDVVDTSTVWVAYDNSVLWSVDGGGTWSSHNTADYTMGICAMPPHAWAVSSITSGTNTTTGVIYHTDDNGKTWVPKEKTLDGEDLPGLFTVSFALEPVPEPSTLVQEILDFIDNSVEAGTLEGSGPGNSGDARLNALTNMMETAADLIEDRNYDGAYNLVEQAHRRCDGLSPPPDFVEGEARGTLAEMAADLMAILLPLR